VSTVFGVVHAADGSTAWSDKRRSYAFVAGRGATCLDDFFGPEVASTVVPLPGVITEEHGGFGHDDTNVIVLVSDPGCKRQTVSVPTATAQIAPSILAALGLSPEKLDVVSSKDHPPCPATLFPPLKGDQHEGATRWIAASALVFT
jgi:hypothetical protein